MTSLMLVTRPALMGDQLIKETAINDHIAPLVLLVDREKALLLKQDLKVSSFEEDVNVLNEILARDGTLTNPLLILQISKHLILRFWIRIESYDQAKLCKLW